MKIQTFIFNWRGQIEKTKLKINQLREIGVDPIVINSDDLNKQEDWYNIGEDSYFTAQFLKALELFDGDILFHIQADASYNNWASLYDDAKKYFEIYNWGIYAPNVDYTFYDSTKTDLNIFTMDESNLRMVANPDSTCWFIHKDILQLAKEKNIDFSKYKMGWSFDIVYTALSYMHKRPVLRDYNHTIEHPSGTNYSKEQAEKEMISFYNTLPEDIQKPFLYIKTDRNKLGEYYT